MLISEYKRNFLKQLEGEYSSEEAHSFFNILVKFYLGLERIDLALEPSKKLIPAEKERLNIALGKLLNHEPIQYITGETEFLDLKFKVNRNVLIPRPETEELVQWIKEDFSGDRETKINILDIGTGSGCIAISLAKLFPQSIVSAIDVSDEALELAKINSVLNQTEINFIKADILNLEKLAEKYDVIVSNPPYVREFEKREMQRNVLEHEPSLALYVKDNDPLIFYKKITKLAEEGLLSNGKLYFETNQYLGDETLEILNNAGFEAELKKDIFGNFRMVRGIKKK